MTKNLVFSESEVFERIVEEGLMNGVVSQEAFHQLVDDVIEDMRRYGELHDDQNLQGHIDALKGRFAEYQGRLE
ncbi:hypothetical protein KBC55_04430 [Patescibacteria group bacterium]|nr:hypothetical protein [Patescibacteria group bacterium]